MPFTIIRNDITNLKVDVIVNAALQMDGGVYAHLVEERTGESARCTFTIPMRKVECRL